PAGRELDDLRHRRHGRGGRGNRLGRRGGCWRGGGRDWGRVGRAAPPPRRRRGGVAAGWGRGALKTRPATPTAREWHDDRPERPRAEERLSHEGRPEERPPERVASDEDVPSCSAESAESHRERSGRRRQAGCDDCKENAEYLREPPHRHATLP